MLELTVCTLTQSVCSHQRTADCWLLTESLLTDWSSIKTASLFIGGCSVLHVVNRHNMGSWAHEPLEQSSIAQAGHQLMLQYRMLRLSCLDVGCWRGWESRSSCHIADFVWQTVVAPVVIFVAGVTWRNCSVSGVRWGKAVRSDQAIMYAHPVCSRIS
jgi:hypothetical protein